MKNLPSPSRRPLVRRPAALTWAGVLLGGWLAGCAHRAPQPTASETSGDPRSELRRLEQGLAAAKSRIEGRGPSVENAAADSASAPSPMAAGAGMSGGRCEAVCQAGQEICSFSRRICQLAGQINDSDSTRSCQRAEKDCQEASSNCASCR
jgi:hypothetical protein